MPHPIRARAALALALSWGLGCAAAESSAAAASDSCAQAATTQASVECAATDAKKWDQRLNTAYQALTQSVEPSQRTPLLDAQRLWIRYRNTNCGFYAAASGSLGRVLAADCVRRMTRQRTCELETAVQPQTDAPPGCP